MGLFSIREKAHVPMYLYQFLYYYASLIVLLWVFDRLFFCNAFLWENHSSNMISLAAITTNTSATG